MKTCDTNVMSDDTHTKKVVALRTFADDVKRAREKQGRTSEVPPDAIIPDTPEVESKAEPETPKNIPHPPISGTHEESAVSQDIPAENGPMEIPPFHFIRASSPDDTTYDDEHAIPDKKTLRSETVRHTAPPKRDSIPTHALDVDTDVIQEHQPSIHTNRDGVFDTEEASLDLGEGSIVTDRKRKRFRLFHAIGIALRGWFGTKKEAIVEARKPKHTIVKSDRRKDVIEAAARRAKHAPSDDYTEVSSRLKNVERITTTEELRIRDAAEVPAPSWKYTDNNEEHDEALESLEAAVRGEDISTQHKVEAVAVAEPSPSTPPVSEPAGQSKPKNTKGTSGYDEYREKYGEDFSPREEAFIESLPPAEESVSVEETEKPSFKKAPVPDYRLNRQGRPVKRQSGTPFLTLVAVIIAAVILGVGSTVWWFTRNTDDTTVAVVPETPDFISTQSSFPVALSSDRLTFYTTLQQAASQAGGDVTQFYPTIGDQPATISSIFATLRLSAPGSFTRNITSITFGSHTGVEPFVVLKTTSFDTAFSGMLTWEQSMSNDLAPLFGSAVFTTAVDSRINNRDVRVLIGADNADKIVYGFLNKNTILITTNRQSYSAVAPLVK